MPSNRDLAKLVGRRTKDEKAYDQAIGQDAFTQALGETPPPRAPVLRTLTQAEYDNDPAPDPDREEEFQKFKDECDDVEAEIADEPGKGGLAE